MKWLGIRRRVMNERLDAAQEGVCLLIWECEGEVFLHTQEMEEAG